jgi:hypothetical protein
MNTIKEVENRDMLIQAISRAGIEALSLGYSQVANFLSRLAAGGPLCQVVVRGGLVQDVHGLPDEILSPIRVRIGEQVEGIPGTLYEILDYDELELDLFDDEIEDIYRRADVPMPDDREETLAGLDNAFAKLEWQGCPGLKQS